MGKVVLVGLVAFALLSLIIADNDLDTQFASWMKKYHKVYSETEKSHRFDVFKQNLEFVNEFNSRKDRTMTVGMNKFADLTNEEFVNKYARDRFTAVLPQITSHIRIQIPISFYWRDHSTPIVPPVNNEGECGSSVIITSVELSEAVCALNTSTFTLLSQQQLIDCTTAGCNGGTFTSVYDYIISKGLESASNYPYNGGTGPCKYNAHLVSCHISDFEQVTAGNENIMAADLVQYGPLSAAIDASLESFQLYSGGVFYAAGCSSTNLDHAVLVVGYGAENGTDYWIAENSWGTDWGLEGYILMSRNRNNNCGIASETYYGIP